MKKLLVFCVALNISLIAALSFVFAKGRYEMTLQKRENESYLQSVRSQVTEQLELSERLFCDESIFESRTRLDRARSLCDILSLDTVSRIIAMGDACFFEGRIYEGNTAKERYSLFISAIKAMINDEKPRDDENEIIENVKIAYENMTFSQNLYPILSSRAEIDEKNAHNKAEALLGEKVILKGCENTLFPMCYAFYGKNTFAVISKSGGRLIKLYFYLESRDNMVNEEGVRGIIETFLAKEGLLNMQLLSIKAADFGGYTARLCAAGCPEAYIMISVSGSGRVCMFDAEAFYRNYGADNDG